MIRFSLAAALLVLIAPGASAADSRFPGTWSCTLNNLSYTGNPAETWSYQFNMMLAAGGGFRAEGSYTSGVHGYYMPFTADGRWSAKGNAFSVEATALKERGPLPFPLYMDYYGPGNMSYRFSSAGGALAVGCLK